MTRECILGAGALCFKQEEKKGKISSCFLNEIQLLSLSYDLTRAGYDNIHFLIAGPLRCIAILKLNFDESQHLFDKFPVLSGGKITTLYLPLPQIPVAPVILPIFTSPNVLKIHFCGY